MTNNWWTRLWGRKGLTDPAPGSSIATFSVGGDSLSGLALGWDAEAYQKALGGNYSWVYACVDLVASSYASLPLLFSAKGETLTTGPAVKLFDLINPKQTQRDLLYLTAVDLQLNGNAYWYLVSGGQNVRELWRLRPDKMTVVPGEKNMPARYELDKGNGKKQPFQPEEILHILKPDPANDWTGLPPMRSAALVAEGDKVAAEANFRMAKRGFKPDGLAKLPGFNPQTRKELAEKQRLFDVEWGGRDSGLKLITDGVEIQPWATTNRDMQYEALRHMNREEICGVFGVPPVLVGILDHATYDNFDTALKVLYGITVWNLAANVAGAITEHLLKRLPPADTCESDFSDVECLQDAKIDEKTLALAEVQAGARTIAEYREEFYPEAEELDWGKDRWEPPSAPAFGALAAPGVAEKDAGGELRPFALGRAATPPTKPGTVSLLP